MQSLSAFNVKGFHAGRAHVCKTTQKLKRKGKKKVVLSRTGENGVTMDSRAYQQWQG